MRNYGELIVYRSLKKYNILLWISLALFISLIISSFTYQFDYALQVITLIIKGCLIIIYLIIHFKLIKNDHSKAVVFAFIIIMILNVMLLYIDTLPLIASDVHVLRLLSRIVIHILYSIPSLILLLFYLINIIIIGLNKITIIYKMIFIMILIGYASSSFITKISTLLTNLYNLSLIHNHRIINNVLSLIQSFLYCILIYNYICSINKLEDLNT